MTRATDNLHHRTARDALRSDDFHLEPGSGPAHHGMEAAAISLEFTLASRKAHGREPWAFAFAIDERLRREMKAGIRKGMVTWSVMLLPDEAARARRARSAIFSWLVRWVESVRRATQAFGH